MNNNSNVRAFNMVKTVSHIGSAVLALNAVRNNEPGSTDALLHASTDLSIWAVERLRRGYKERQGSARPELGDANNVVPPELNKTFLESFATSINKSFSDNGCDNITVSYIGSINESCSGLGDPLFCGQLFQYSLSITIKGSKINTAENNECGEKNEKSQCGEKNDSDFFNIPVNEMKEIQKKILNKEDPPLKNYYIKTFQKWYLYPIIKYGANNYQYTLNIEFKGDNKLCCRLSPLERCKNTLAAALGECSESNPSNLPTITICGSCK